jgi:hypothetical protein
MFWTTTYRIICLFSVAVKEFLNVTFITALNKNYITWSDNKVRELIAVKLLYNSSLKTTLVAFNVHPSGSYAPMPAPGPPFKIIFEMVSWNDLQICRCVTPDVINVIQISFFQYLIYLLEQNKVTGIRRGVSKQLFV